MRGWRDEGLRQGGAALDASTNLDLAGLLGVVFKIAANGELGGPVVIGTIPRGDAYMLREGRQASSASDFEHPQFDRHHTPWLW